MKRKILLLLTLIVAGLLNAQVGINTENPQGMFHIDGQGNTTANTNISDDVVVTATGNVGVGTNAPATKVDIRTSTAGNGFRLQDGTQGNGMVLTSDANGNGKWAAPGFSDFTRIEPATLLFSIPRKVGGSISSDISGTFIAEKADGTPYTIILPSMGTYSLTIGARFSFTNLNSNSIVHYAIVQLLPGNDISLWNAVIPRFEGSYEVYAMQKKGYEDDWRAYLSQNITTTTTTGQTLYFALDIGGVNLPDPIKGTFYIGSSDFCPQCTGGSYVRIN